MVALHCLLNDNDDTELLRAHNELLIGTRALLNECMIAELARIVLKYALIDHAPLPMDVRSRIENRYFMIRAYKHSGAMDIGVYLFCEGDAPGFIKIIWECHRHAYIKYREFLELLFDTHDGISAITTICQCALLNPCALSNMQYTADQALSTRIYSMVLALRARLLKLIHAK